MSETRALTSDQLAKIARGALDNSIDLLSDARLLLDAGRWPRAYALAILAGEEYGKFQMTVMIGLLGSDDPEAWREYWQNFNSHHPGLPPEMWTP